MNQDINRRRAIRPGEAEEPRIERVDRVWHIRSLATARQVLQARHATTQAGFTAEWIPRGRLKHHPILISDGPDHDRQRRKVARFFAPTVVAERYTGQMHRSADRWLAPALAAGRCSLDELALHYTVDVTRHVVGLTESSVPAMSRRLVGFFRQPPFDITRDDLGRTRGQWARAAFNGLVPIVRFWLADVRPAVRRRRREPAEDVVSHLIAEGYGNAEILVECVTYGTAGMVTTREFISMACWHLLTHPELAARYRAAEQQERLAILAEIIRLEPVVGHLYRRMQQPVTVTDAGRRHTLSPGDLVDICVRQANTDPDTAGAQPHDLCPGRDMPGADASGLSFGDGAHKCPGRPLALLESDVLLTKLLGHRPRIVREPRLGWDDLVAGYTLRDFELAFDAPA